MNDLSGIEAILDPPTESFDDFSLEELIETIDHYYTIMKGHVNRVSVEWGKWSRAMNLSLRRRQKALDEDDPEKDRLYYIHAYWIVRSRMIDQNLIHKLLRKSKLSKSRKELKQLKEFALGEKNPPKISEETLVKMLTEK